MPVTPLAKTSRHTAVAKAARHAAAATDAHSAIAQVARHLEAGEWEAAHVLAQKDASPLGCWAHGIVHLIEGDLDNAKYWYRRAHRSLPHGDTVAAEIAALKVMVRHGAR